MKNDDLSFFFDPASVALIGATEKLGFGYGQTRTMVERWKDNSLFLVNRSSDTVFGVKTYKDIDDTPGAPELAVIMTPARVTPGVVEQCGQKGIKGAIVLSAGFAETGPEGAELQKELTGAATRNNIRVIGPNCVGLVNTSNRFSTTEVIEEALVPGNIGIIAQSGVFGNILMDCGPDEGVRYSKVITIGNRCDLNESDMIEYLAADEQTRVISLYLEGVADPKRFLETVTRVSRIKPVVILKSGITEQGVSATASHTGSLSGSDRIFSGVFKQAGVIRVDNIQEFFDLSKTLSTQPLPVGKRVGILTTSGSIGVLSADACSNAGLEIPTLTHATVEAFKQETPSWMNIRNPLDVGPSPYFLKGLKALIDDPNIDAVLANFLIPWMIVQELRSMGKGQDPFVSSLPMCLDWLGKKPVVFTVVGKQELRSMIIELVGDRIPVLASPEIGAKALYSMYKLKRWRDG
jgi:acetyltransferase